MFRKMARIREQIPNEECIEILKTQLRGVLSVLGDDDYPYGIPINHYYCEEDGKLYFHGGTKGHRIDAMRSHGKASFCVLDEGRPEQEGGWALRFRSVIVFGRLEEVEDHDRAIEITRALCHKFTSDEEYIEKEIENAGARTMVICLTPEHITGKTVLES